MGKGVEKKREGERDGGRERGREGEGARERERWMMSNDDATWKEMQREGGRGAVAASLLSDAHRTKGGQWGFG